jgi:uncharacterized repeat protein (TIGR02543 family)
MSSSARHGRRRKRREERQMNLGHFVRSVALLGALASCLEGSPREQTEPRDSGASGEDDYTLTVQTSGDGTTNPAAGTHSYPAGTLVEVTATPNADATFAGWSGAASGTAGRVTITMNANKVLIANFSGAATRYTLTIRTSGDGTTEPQAGIYTHDAGAKVTVRATPAAGATFTGWSGEASGTDNPATITMDADKVLTANFSSDAGSTKYTLTINVSGAGSTDPAVGAHLYDAGAKVAVKATPAAGATFTGWSGDATGTASPVSITMDANKSLTASFSAAPAPTTYDNPVLWDDLADADVIRVDDTFYYMASTMHYSPGAPILRSYDLVNWEYVSHAVPVLDYSPAYDLNGGRAYIRGIWASSINYRKSNKTFYWIGCMDGKTYTYTATSVEGPWQKHGPINNCYYDAGLLIDDDDSMYVAYGNNPYNVAKLSADGFSQVSTQQVYKSSFMMEGSRFYKYNGTYYIFLTRPADGQFVLKSSGGPFGPYTAKALVDRTRTPISGAGVPHQGGLVQLQNDDWYYMAFVDAYPGGRVPVLAPIKWGSDGWPTLQTVDNGWGASYPYPKVPTPPRAMKPSIGVYTFSGSALEPEWEWNHNPDNTKWSMGNGLKLQTATVTNDLYAARNTLTHRIRGPSSTATVVLDYSNMKDGDRAGLALLRDSSAWVGVKRDGGAAKVVMVSGLSMDGGWKTTSTGSEVASAAVSGGRIWLRVAADIRPGGSRPGRFSYSTDGTTFTPIGNQFNMHNGWQFFMGYRFAVFNFATQSLGGSVSVSSFEVAVP